MSSAVPINQIARVLRTRLRIWGGSETFREADRSRVLRSDVTHQRLQLCFPKGPIAQRDCSFECIPFTFGRQLQLPTEFWFGVSRTLIDLDPPDALSGLSKLDGQISNAEETP